MTEIEEALGSCMERLVTAREEREQISVKVYSENHSKVELFL
jgi:hypothetical protein